MIEIKEYGKRVFVALNAMKKALSGLKGNEYKEMKKSVENSLVQMSYRENVEVHFRDVEDIEAKAQRMKDEHEFKDTEIKDLRDSVAFFEEKTKEFKKIFGIVISEEKSNSEIYEEIEKKIKECKDFIKGVKTHFEFCDEDMKKNEFDSSSLKKIMKNIEENKKFEKNSDEDIREKFKREFEKFEKSVKLQTKRLLSEVDEDKSQIIESLEDQIKLLNQKIQKQEVKMNEFEDEKIREFEIRELEIKEFTKQNLEKIREKMEESINNLENEKENLKIENEEI